MSDRRGVSLRVKAEGTWWAMRPNFYSHSVSALVGLYAASGRPTVAEIVGLIVFIASMGGLTQLLNDILDHEKDAVTAPYLPIPAGLLPLRSARVGAAALLVVAFGGLLLATGPTIRFVWVLGATTLSVVASIAYSVFKEYGILASAFAALVYSSSALAGWLVGGLGGTAIVLVLLDAFFSMFFGNTWAALRDVDADAKVGNRTLPVRIGAFPAFVYSYALSTISLGFLVALALTVPGGHQALVPITLLIVWVLANGPRVGRTFRIADRGRSQRSKDLRPLFNANAWRNCVALAVFSLPAGLIAFVALESINAVQRRGYRRRLLEGGLAADAGLDVTLATPTV